MSKFCGVISDNGKDKSKLQEPLTFGQLEGLINWLIKDTLSEEDDFTRKASYVAERDVMTCSNNEQLIKLNEEVHKYRDSLSVVEEEIREHEKILSSITEIANYFEERQGKSLNLQFQSDYASFVSLIEALDAQMMVSNANMTKINEFIAAAGIRPTNEATQQVIISILNRHLDLLLHIEYSLARLHENCDSVESQLQVLRRKQTQLFDC